LTLEARYAKLGDINLDGKRNTGDVAELLTKVVKGSKLDDTTKAIADINGDKTVNTGDVAELLTGVTKGTYKDGDSTENSNGNSTENGDADVDHDDL
jgi:hypothetical protein